MNSDDNLTEDANPTINIQVEAKPDESAEQLLRRFNREFIRSGLKKRMQELEFYEKPSQRRKREEREKYEEKRRRRWGY